MTRNTSSTPAGGAGASSVPDGAEVQLSTHIFSVSAALVGACLTVRGRFRVSVRSQHVDSLADNLLVVAGLIAYEII